MNKDYSNYLLSIILIIIVISSGVLFVFAKIRKKSKINAGMQPIRGGSISIFFDRMENVTIIPHVKDKYGSGKATADVELIKKPYSAQKLGSVVRQSMNRCIKGVTCENRELFEKLQSYDWVQFTEGKRNISVYKRELRYNFQYHQKKA